MNFKELGFRSYSAYLRSPHWKTFRAKFRRTGRKWACSVCDGEKELELHHKTYDKLGKEELTDVIPLCHSCHGEVHSWLDADGSPVEQTDKVVAILRKAREKSFTRPRKRKSEWYKHTWLKPKDVPPPKDAAHSIYLSVMRGRNSS